MRSRIEIPSKRRAVFEASLLACLWLGGCARAEPRAPVEFADAYLNKQIRLIAPGYLNSFRTDRSVGLEVLYAGQGRIIFPADFNVRIFYAADADWVEIGERPTQRLPADEIEFRPENGQNQTVATFFPNIPDPGQPYRLRIYVVGKMVSAEGSPDVAAFADLNLVPGP